MEQLAKAMFLVKWHDQEEEQRIEVQHNPTELSYDKSAQIADIAIPGLDSPLQQYIRGQVEKLTVELFFDTTDEGMGKKAVSVTRKTDQIYQLIKIEPTRHAPPVCTFFWNNQCAGSTIGGSAGNTASDAASAVAGAAAGAAAAAVAGAVAPAVLAGTAVAEAAGNQRRNGFKCIVESVKQKFTLFSPEGVPLRATLTVVLREYKTLDEQLAHLNLTSPDRTHSHVLQSGETLSGVAARFYQRAGDWRFIAAANEIEDPRRLAAGTFLTIPPTR